MNKFRIEEDSLGEVRVPHDAYWGPQTQRAVDNFPVSGMTFPPVFIRAMVLIKRACAGVNRDLRLLDAKISDAVVRVCDEIIGGGLSDQFPLDVFQTGSGTSTNMNVNEVIATRANELLTGSRHAKNPVHPNDHVNLGQSSNDVIPTAIHIAAYLLTTETLLPALELLHGAIRDKQKKYANIVKTGRTHLMDAMPITLGQEMSAWSTQVANARTRVEETLPRIAELAIGGTAVGTGINTQRAFGALVTKELSRSTKIKFVEAPNHFEAQSAQDAVTELSGQLKTYATSLMKISNDLRWMNSGPIAGLGEVRLPSLQPGSSIMPGKVNPVIAESARMVSAQVIGNDTTIAIANALGDFQLNVMMPVIAHNILQSISLLANISRLLASKAIEEIEVDEARLSEFIHRNPIIATVLNPIIGYDKAVEVVKKAINEKKTVKQVVVELRYLSAAEANRILDPVVMTKPGFSGKTR